MTNHGDIVFATRAKTIAFRDPHTVLCARRLEEVPAVLELARAAVQDRQWVAGYLAYEAAPALDPALCSHPPGGVPLAWFGVYGGPGESPAECGPYHVGDWAPAITPEAYRDAVGRIRAYIAAGDTYQVNYTFPLRAAFLGDAFGWFRDLCLAQQSDHCVYLHADSYRLVCASPELFFRQRGNVLVTRPMKGTRSRGRWCGEDRQLALELEQSEKDRAENVMIVDLLRNDMGRISDTGSVRVERLFDIERYPTVWQMTSCISSRTGAALPQILGALFPSGSVTGAPKVRTMQIIRELEPCPRGAYCGTMGWWAPDGRAEFNVAIRCATIDAQEGIAEYPVGSGITWDSDAGQEYEECISKAAVLSRRSESFEILETLLFDGEYFLLEGHLARMAASADYFGFPFDEVAARAALEITDGAIGPLRVRMTLDAAGRFRVAQEPAPPVNAVRLGFAREPIDSRSVFLYHKTTQRGLYEIAKASRPDCDDVLLFNERGEATESCTANLVLEVGGEKVTPPIRSGLLGGAFRERLIAQGQLRECVLSRDDVGGADKIWLINSVRKWIPVVWMG